MLNICPIIITYQVGTIDFTVENYIIHNYILLCIIKPMIIPTNIKHLILLYSTRILISK